MHFNFGVLEQVIAAGFVFPCATEAAEFHTPKLENIQVQIMNGCLKRSAGIVIAFDRQNFTAMAFLCHVKDEEVREIATGYQQVNVAVRNLRAQ